MSISSELNTGKIITAFSGFKNWVKINRWKAFGLLVLAAASTIVYVSNVMAVNSLLEDNRKLEKQITEIKNLNEILNSRIIELESAERITEIAEKQLGMKKPDAAPTIIP